MVLKPGKYGVGSGNTFRASNTGYHRRYRRECLLTRTVQTEERHSGVNKYLQDDIVTNNLVTYSLNKRKRWRFPEIFKDKLRNGELVTEGFNLQLMEMHSVDKMSHCISLCCTDGNSEESTDEPFIREKRHDYFNAKSVLTASRHGLSKRARRNRPPYSVSDKPPPEINKPNMVTYGILYPCPANSSLTYVAGYVGYHWKRSTKWRSYYDQQEEQRRKRKAEPHSIIRECVSSMGMDEDENLEGKDETCVDKEQAEKRTEKMDVMIEDIITKAQPTKILSRDRTQPRNSRKSNCGSKGMFGKNHVRYENPQTSLYDTLTRVSDDTSLRSESICTEHVSVVLPREEVSGENLTRCYGNAYRECNCFPTKFVLNISEEVSNVDCFKEFCRKNLRGINACLVFDLDTNSKCNNTTKVVYKVSLKTNFNVATDCVKIETLFDNMEFSVSDVIHRTLFYIETFPLDAFRFSKVSHSYRNGRCGSASCLQECANWKAHSYLPSDYDLFKSFFRMDKGRDGKETNNTAPRGVGGGISPELTPQNSAVCRICYEPYVTRPRTALTSCVHWFCDDCWKEYLETKVRLGAASLFCPEYKCNTLVDSGTVLAFINTDDAIKLAKIKHSNDVQEQAVKKWCPNKTCHRVVVANSSKVKTAYCDCGREMCFECFGLPHWPASCEATANYTERVQGSSDASVVPEEFEKPIRLQGKHCPHCGRFVTRSRGCLYITCVCQKGFCWNCGMGFQEGINHTKCNSYKREKYQVKTKEIESYRIPSRRKSWYKTALAHRVAVHPLKIQSMRSKLTTICKRLQSYAVRTTKMHQTLEIKFELEGITFAREEDKIPQFLVSVIMLYKEMHQLCEYTAVLLGSSTLDKTTKTKLHNVIARMSNLSSVIYELFVNNSTTPTTELLHQLQEARCRARTEIQCLFKCASFLCK